MVKEYLHVAPTYVVDQTREFWPDLNAHIRGLASGGFLNAITNSVFSGNIIDALKNQKIKIVSLLHELPNIITSGGGEGHIRKIYAGSDVVVFPNRYVENALTLAYGRTSSNAVVRPQGMYKDFSSRGVVDIRSKLGLERTDKLVINVGYADLRKGVDHFVNTAGLLFRSRPDVHFLWLGARDSAVHAWLRGNSPNIHFADFTADVGAYLASSDIFFLSSREDPFPSVVMEALSFGMPVIAFDEAGGASELLKDHRLGRVIPMGDLPAAAETVLHLVDEKDQSNSEESRRYRQEYVRDNFGFPEYCYDLLALSTGAVKVSVIVPNYNYSRYLSERLHSIFAQSYPLFEVIVLDDASSDQSVQTLEHIAEDLKREFTLIENTENSGNVFRQWRRGVSAAKGDLVWIAEADDLSDPGFLRRMVDRILAADALFCFCDSRAIDADGSLIYENYKGYYSSLFEGALSTSGVYDTGEFLGRFLSVRNMVLNASSVVWKRSALEDAFARFPEEQIDELRLAGDWKLYANVCLSEGTIAYEANPLNVHRRHKDSVTGKIDPVQHVSEIAEVHSYINRVSGGATFSRAQQEYVELIKRQLKLG